MGVIGLSMNGVGNTSALLGHQIHQSIISGAGGGQ